MKYAAMLVALAGVAACTPAARTAPAPVASRVVEQPGALRWMRRSAEYRALTRQTYAAAARRLDELAPAVAAGSWGVILDADETVLDNSAYERRRALLDSGYTDASWAAWVKEEAAAAVPGAPGFTAHVRALGGRVVIVTNRADSLCAETRANLRSAGIAADVVLCQPPGESDKNPRFARVERGTAGAGVPPLMILEWVGDNIQDFPRLTQAMRGDSSAFTPFGRTFWVLPNPVYGSWEKNTAP